MRVAYIIVLLAGVRGQQLERWLEANSPSCLVPSTS